VILGLSPRRSIADEARMAGLAWESLPDPKPRLTLEIHSPNNQEHVFYLGPHAPHLTPKEIDLLHNLWLEFSNDVAPEELHHRDVVHFALEELMRDAHNSKREEVIERLKEHLYGIRTHRAEMPKED
jgi:hypothetical protein